MDPQEVKNILKNARDALKNKQYQDAMKLCRVFLNIIKSRKNFLQVLLFRQ